MVAGHKKTSKKGAQKPEEPVPEGASDAESPVASEEAETQPDGPDTAEETAEPDLESQLTEANDKFLRAKAELENYRRRTQREFTDIRAAVKMMVIQEFLPVLDHFQMALDHADQDADYDALKRGMDMISNEFKRTLEALGVTAVATVGEPFDPNQHEAVAQEPSDDVPEGHVLKEWKSGYRMGDRLVRPATVVVSAGTPAEDDEGDGEDE